MADLENYYFHNILAKLFTQLYGYFDYSWFGWQYCWDYEEHDKCVPWSVRCRVLTD